MIDLNQILRGLVERTEEGKLKWSRGTQNGRFITSVDGVAVAIREIADPSYAFEIFNESGEMVASLDFADSSEAQDQQLSVLFALARISALDVDSTLEKLARGLEL